MMPAPDLAAMMPCSTISATAIGISGWRSRPHGPLRAASRKTRAMFPGPLPTPVPPSSGACRLKRLEFVDEPFDDRKAALPETRVARIQSKRLQQFLVVLGSPGRQHLKISFRKAAARTFVDGIKRIDQTITE